MQSMLEALERAVELAGGQTQFADKLNEALGMTQPPRAPDAKPIRQQHVDYWVRVAKKLPSELARAAELTVGSQVTRYQFRPDVFGPAPGLAPPPPVASHDSLEAQS